jgi:hypothetical protein
MAQVWVQVWTAQVPGSVQVEQSELAKVQGLENLKAMVPMLVEVREKEWEMVPSVLVKDSPLVTVQEMETAKAEAEALRSALVWERVKVQQLESALQTVTVKEKVPMSETAKESALSKGWGWVLGSAEQSPPQLQQEQHKPE